MSDEAKGALVFGIILDLLIMGSLMTFVGKNNPHYMNKLREKCELNIPRNQS